MYRTMTIALDEAVYEGLHRTVGHGKISQFIENLVRPHVLDNALEESYRAMAADQEYEAEAQEWINAVNGDIADDALNKGYRVMAADTVREAEAQEWCNALIGDVPDEPW